MMPRAPSEWGWGTSHRALSSSLHCPSGTSFVHPGNGLNGTHCKGLQGRRPGATSSSDALKHAALRGTGETGALAPSRPLFPRQGLQPSLWCRLGGRIRAGARPTPPLARTAHLLQRGLPQPRPRARLRSLQPAGALPAAAGRHLCLLRGHASPPGPGGRAPGAYGRLPAGARMGDGARTARGVRRLGVTRGSGGSAWCVARASSWPSLLTPLPSPGAAAGRASRRCAGQGLSAGGGCGPALCRLLGPHPAVPGAAGAWPRGRLASAQLRSLRAQDLGALHVLQQLGAEPAALRLPGLPLSSGLPPRLPLRFPASQASPVVWTLGPSHPASRAAPPGRPPGSRQDPEARQRRRARAAHAEHPSRTRCSSLSPLLPGAGTA